MALISCPECNKEKVSNVAPNCPECGFAIREHFEKIEQEELARKNEIQKRKQADESRKREIENKKAEEQRKFDSITKPEKPKFFGKWVISGIILVAFGGLPLFTRVGRMMYEDTPSTPISIIIGGVVFFVIGVCLYSKNLFEYIDASDNFEEYRKQKFQEQRTMSIRAEQNQYYRQQREVNINTPKCPKCGSTAITTGQRGFNVWTGFLGSGSTVNRCANCGHKWKP